MCALPTIGTNGSGGISASYLNQLIQSTMETKRQPLNALKAEQDQLELQRSVYTDLKSLIEALKTEGLKLGSGSTSVVTQKSISVSDTSYFTASAASSAGTGSYTIEISQLAAAHSVKGRDMLRSDTLLNLTTTTDKFYLGGVDKRVATVRNDGGLVAAAGASDYKAPAAGQSELASGDYTVEFQKQSEVWKFRIVDRQGQAVSVRDAGSTTGGFTSGWQSVAAANGTNPEDKDGALFDTGRGLSFSFGAVPLGDKLGQDAPVLSYQAQGAAISVDATDTLQTVAKKINQAAYVAGNEVSASIVNNRLILSAKNTGYQIEAVDGAQGPLAALGLKGGADDDGDGWDGTALAGWVKDPKSNLYGLALAKFTVNGMDAVGYTNTGLAGVIDGVTLNLQKQTAGPVTLTVSDNNTAITNQLNSFINQFNKVTTYLADKTKVEKNADGQYTRGALAEDTVMNRLRMDLISDAIKQATSGTLRSLREIGVTFNPDTMTLSVSDTGKLSSQLQQNRNDVTGLLDAVVSRLQTRLDTFTGEKGVLATSVTRMQATEKDLTKRIADMNTRLSDEEMVLTRRYARTLAQLADMQSQASYVYGLSSTFNISG